AAGISRRQALPAWLHTVASRVALQARARRVPVASEGLDQVAAPEGDRDRREVLAVLDEEVRRPPGKEQVPLGLCHLEGRTNEEAARELGRPVGTVQSRLARARQRLRERLARRGLAPAALAGPAPVVPSQLVGSTVCAALAVASKQAGAVSAPAL